MSDEEKILNLVIKCSNADKYEVQGVWDEKVLKFKERIAEKVNVPVTQQRLIYKGKVLKDDLTLENYNVEDGHTIHLVKSSTSPSPTANSTPTPPVAPSVPLPSQPTFPNNTNQPNLFGSFGRGTIPGGMPDINNILNNPEMMQQVMNSPMMQSLTSNPEVMRNMMMSNPEMRAMMDANPQIREAISDPGMMSQVMEMMRNPNALREMQRGQDLQLSQIENMPGGFNMLRQMYEQVQEPMMNAMNTMQTPPQQQQQQQQQGTALPNPWATSTPTSLGTNSNSNQMIQQMLANPNIMQQVSAAAASMNPELINNPQTQALLSNPNLMSQMLNPANMQALLQMQQAMQTLQSNGFPLAGMMPTTPNQMQSQSAPQSVGHIDFSPFIRQNISPMGNIPLASNPSATGTFSVPSLEIRYASQLEQLRSMGFNDNARNIQILQLTNGDVTAAVERLLQ